MFKGGGPGLTPYFLVLFPLVDAGKKIAMHSSDEMKNPISPMLRPSEQSFFMKNGGLIGRLQLADHHHHHSLD
jgi:hypothetical protein